MISSLFWQARPQIFLMLASGLYWLAVGAEVK
jgi:hypothetical protein